jgi:hypothetical protein
VLFAHQLLQEYLAARRLAASPKPRLVQRPWRASRTRPRLKALLKTLPDSDPLPLIPSTGWEETTVLAAAMTTHPDAVLTDLMRVNLPLAGRCAAQPDVTIGEDLTTEIQRALIGRTEDPRADLRARIAAGLALGEVGDPRVEKKAASRATDHWMPRSGISEERVALRAERPPTGNTSERSHQAGRV